METGESKICSRFWGSRLETQESWYTDDVQRNLLRLLSCFPLFGETSLLGFFFFFFFFCLFVCLFRPLVWFAEKAMAPHSCTLAWKTPWMEKPGCLQSMESQRVGQGWATSLFLYSGSDSKESACSAGDAGLIPGLRKSPGEGNGYPLQYSCLEDFMGLGVWWATVRGVPVWINNFPLSQFKWQSTFYHFICLIQWFWTVSLNHGFTSEIILFTCLLRSCSGRGIVVESVPSPEVPWVENYSKT